MTTSNDFRQFYRQHHQAVRSLVFRLGVGSNDLEDIVQNVFLKAWNKEDSFKGQSSKKTWLLSIAVHSTYDFFRRQKPIQLEGETDHWSKSLNIETEHANQELVDYGLKSISFDHRTVLVMHVIEGYSVEEISDSLGIAVGTVKSRLGRAREAFKKSLEKLEALEEKNVKQGT